MLIVDTLEVSFTLNEEVAVDCVNRVADVVSPVNDSLLVDVVFCSILVSDTDRVLLCVISLARAVEMVLCLLVWSIVVSSGGEEDVVLV